MANKQNKTQRHKELTDSISGMNEDKSNVVSKQWKEKRNYTVQFKKKSQKKNTGARRASPPDAETAELEKRARDWRKRVDAALEKEGREHRIEECKQENKRLRQDIDRMEQTLQQNQVVALPPAVLMLTSSEPV